MTPANLHNCTLRCPVALSATLDADAFARLSGTVSLPFPVSAHKRIAIKLIDPRGNEVLRVHKLDQEYMTKS